MRCRGRRGVIDDRAWRSLRENGDESERETSKGGRQRETEKKMREGRVRGRWGERSWPKSERLRSQERLWPKFRDEGIRCVITNVEGRRDRE